MQIRLVNELPTCIKNVSTLLIIVFLSCKANARRSVHSPQDHFVISLATDVTDATLGASGL